MDISSTELAVWKEQYRVGAPALDGQHQAIFRLIHDLQDEAAKGHGPDVLSSTLDQLVQEVRNHFRDEEAMLVKCRFPRYSSHRAEHQKLMNQILDLQAALQKGETAVTPQVVQFLADWHEQHISTSDLQYVPYLMVK